MKMLTKEIEKRIPGIGETSGDAPEPWNGENVGDKARVHVKFFSPWTGWTWYATEYDPVERRFFGYIKGDYPEYGYFSLDELESVEMMPGVPAVERDMYWNWKTTIDKVVEAVERGDYL
jgi:hypothetical protein